MISLNEDVQEGELQLIPSTFADEEAIRRDERLRLAALLEEHGETISGFTSDDSATVKLVAFLLRLPSGNADPQDQP